MASTPFVNQRESDPSSAPDGTEPPLTTTPTAEELEVMNLMAVGLKDFAIARRLDVSVVTVRRRARSFRQRVGAMNRSEAIALGVFNGFLNPTETRSQQVITAQENAIEEP